ncbi:hypothetical protein Nepgr_029147 [Nepenthes gracilis]|uniref:Uncharacterized protein n=1 Tax=Nepenthes gracilis TaxID=150966 RepID=A0AAD3TE66_NEPGR|nr:hypothetical protein Nepgr_029147 [Nepenthes gracilis]
MEETEKEENQQVLRVLELLKQASHDLQSNSGPPPTESNSSAIKALLELETESDTILSSDPNLSQLSHHLSSLKALVETLQKTRGHGLRSFLRRRASTHEIARVAGSIESELQAWIDRESLENLVKSLQGYSPSSSNSGEDELIRLLTQLGNRISQGFNRELQDLVLKSRVFSELEKILCKPDCPNKLREHCAFAIDSLIRFNKDVFVGQVWMGPTIYALISIGSSSSLKVLCSLIKSIKSPLADEIESNREIPKIIAFLSSTELEIKIVAIDCVLEIGYFGRKEAIEAMITEGLIEKLVELQRSELGGDLIDVGRWEENREERANIGGEETERKWRKESRENYLQRHPFASCVARFAVQLEVGEGLRQREKRAFKQEILRRVREASVSDAEAATIVAEVLWGSSP